MSKKRKVIKMPQVETKPIRPTRITFASSDEKMNFVNNATKSEKTKTVGMDKVRRMVRDHKDNRK
ncbi:hypothetical protein M6D81_11800 [Paenibacillus sp. J5C_2022]|uniref:hypothetical protein n=1 Tax=Paenibacillus sp. J5C2022 TaxID=2977129 RepID=UPI0021D179E4|nr:hypothetical protein [Paenibacillus sp. J5C2022]MCU6709388.1 hypothetical protein [Paenibacillus sp. J5C2022]